MRRRRALERSLMPRGGRSLDHDRGRLSCGVRPGA